MPDIGDVAASNGTRAPRRVTVVAHELLGFRPAGGMGTATTFLALALARMGHSVELLLGFDSPGSMDPYWRATYEQAGIRIRRAPVSDEPVEPWHFVHTHSIALGLQADPPDVVIAHDFGAPAYSALRLRQAGIALLDTLFVVFCHGARRYILDLSPSVGLKDLRQVLAVSALEQAAIELADVAVSPSAYLVEWMRTQGWRLPERTVVIPYFARSAVIDDAPKPASPSTSSGVERLTFFGRIDEKKGLRIFAAAVNALEPELLERLELEFLGKTTATWTQDRAEALLSDRTRRALRGVSFETELDQREALARLRRPGTLAVMPTLLDNSPNTVYECLEHGIPFIASDVGGIPELIAPEERRRVLFEPTPAGVEAALRRAFSGPVRPVRASFTSTTSYEHWADVLASRLPRETTAVGPAVDIVVRSGSRAAQTLEAQTHENVRVIPSSDDGSAPYVLFLADEDLPDESLLEALVHAQTVSGADAVSCGLRLIGREGGSTLHFFIGDPGGLGALSNEYGTVALVRRELLTDVAPPWPPEEDPDWPFLAGLAATGARIVSVPAPLVTRTVRAGSVEWTPGDALLVLERLERVLPDALEGTARLAAGLAADSPPPGSR
jgi:glycosyltransferase involved in cell wall biosynthesis